MQASCTHNPHVHTCTHLRAHIHTGAISLYDQCSAAVTGCVFANNSVRDTAVGTSGGGAINVEQNSVLTIVDSSLRWNTAELGQFNLGGACIVQYDSQARFENVEFLANSATASAETSGSLSRTQTQTLPPPRTLSHACTRARAHTRTYRHTHPHPHTHTHTQALIHSLTHSPADQVS